MTEVAIVHDYLTQRGGAERLVLEMVRTFPDAVVHTTLFDAEHTFPEFADVDVRVSGLNRAAALRSDHRRALPLLAPTVSRMKVDADVVLCSSSGWAHGVRTSGAKVVYCHNTARWLYQSEAYLREAPRVVRAGLPVITPALRRWDRRAAASADHYIANSENVADRVRAEYGIEPSVLHPCRALEPGGSVEMALDIEPGFVLSVGRLLPYKNVDVVIGALEHLDGAELVIVGGGPDKDRLRELAKGLPVHFVGPRSDPELRWFYANCGVVASMAYEDFGIVPVEAASFGRPVVALRWGGFLESVIDGTTGVFVDEVDAVAVAAALRTAFDTSWDVEKLVKQGNRFAPEVFRGKLSQIVGDWS